MSNNIVVGIDPGESTGFAQFENGKLTRLWTFKPLQAIAYLQSRDEGLYVMEDSRKQSCSFKNLFVGTAMFAFSRGRSVGTVDRLCNLYQEALGKNKLIMLSPREKGSKIKHDVFVIKTGWEGKSNEHSRDAAMVAWTFRNGAK
jgi:hypothetical protein